MMTQSSELLTQARERIRHTQEAIQHTQEQLTAQSVQLGEQFKKAEGAEKLTLHTLLQYTKKRQTELTSLFPSPYFSRCDTQSEGKDLTLYIGKFSYPEESVVSWVSPISTLRFAHPGVASYSTPERSKKEVLLKRKDEYMIQDGAIKFFATERLDQPRTLVFQEHFSNRKTGFMLPEIVARMEEAQDKVIRSSWRGPLVISGPAGSGKTTLALHRVAYLMQVPEIKDHFPASRIRVFVQDEGTKSYFSALLPELGIDNVEITTFQAWASDILELSKRKETWTQLSEEVEDAITIQKLKLLRSSLPSFTSDSLRWLKTFYQKNIHSHQEVILERLNQNIFDDIDLTIFLQAYKKTHGLLHESREYLVQQKNTFEVKRKMGRFAVSYNLCIVDEFQNYLPEQLLLLRGCMNEETQSIIYVGDMRQQTRFGTIQSWEQIGEKIEGARLITLEKVYRNTKEILRYIQKLGYDVTIPNALPEGEPVQVLADTDKTIKYISERVLTQTDRLIGILAKNSDDLKPYLHLQAEKHVKVLTIREAQGVEFDTVFLVGNTHDTWKVDSAYSEEVKEEKQRVNKDLLYVALTRAMRELSVVGII